MSYNYNITSTYKLENERDYQNNTEKRKQKVEKRKRQTE